MIERNQLRNQSGNIAAIPSGALEPTSTPQWYETVITYDQLATGGLTGDVLLFTLPAGSFIHNTIIELTESFVGASIVTLNVTVGVTGSETDYLGVFNALQSVTNSAVSMKLNETVATSIKAARGIRLFATSVGAFLDTATQGRVVVRCLISRLL